MTKLLIVSLFIGSFIFGWQTNVTDHSNEGMTIATVMVPAEPDAKMMSWYSGYNATYFNDALPHDTFVFITDLPTRYIGLTFECGQARYCIAIDRKLNPTIQDRQFTLLHEMVHVQFYGNLDYTLHREPFKRRMRELCAEGAFDDIF